MDIRKIKKLIELVEESGINELEISEGEESVRICRGVPASMMQAAPMMQAALMNQNEFIRIQIRPKDVLQAGNHRDLRIRTSRAGGNLVSQHFPDGRNLARRRIPRQGR